MGKKSSRKKGMLVVKPIIYGNASVYLGKKAVDGVRTHNWTVYVRGLTPEDDLSYISKVEFMLHPDFKDPTRIVEHPPFEISEGGWGEFEIQINIYFKDPTIKPINVYHPLKLWSAEQATATQRKPYVDESYDELLFFEPSEDFYQTLLANQPFKQNTPYRKSYRLSCQQTIDQYAPIFSEEKELQRVNDAIKKVNDQINIYEARNSKAEETIKVIKEEIQNLKNKSL